MFGTIEFILVAIVLTLLFGPEKIPKFAKHLGAAIGEFKKVQNIKTNFTDTLSSYTEFSGVDIEAEIEHQNEEIDNTGNKQ